MNKKYCCWEKNYNKKGRYVAIQELLPIIGAIRLLELASPSTAHNGYNYNEINKILTGRKSNPPLPLSLTSSPLIDSLISGIISDHGDGTGNAGVASSLFGKFLSSLGWEMMTKLIEAKEVIRVQDICDKDSSNNININKSIYESVNQKKSELKHVFPPTGWTETWMRPLLMNLVSCDAKKAKRTSQFCLPAIVTAASGVLSRFRSGEITQSGVDAGRLAFASILDHLGATRVTVGTKCELIGVDDKSSVNDNVEYNIGVNNHYDEESESFSIANHRLLWAKLEVSIHTGISYILNHLSPQGYMISIHYCCKKTTHVLPFITFLFIFRFFVIGNKTGIGTKPH